MIESINFLHKFIGDCTISRMIKWIDLHFENSWSTAVEDAGNALNISKTIEEIKIVDQKFLKVIKEMSEAYFKSEEYEFALSEQCEQMFNLENKEDLEPLGIIIHRIVKKMGWDKPSMKTLGDHHE